MSEHLETRKKLKEIPELCKFEDLLSRSTLSPEDKQILRLHYLERRNFSYIADSLGYATITIKRKHSRALSKLTKLF